MILRWRADALSTLGRRDPTVTDPAEVAWAATIHRLAASHRQRRELDAAIRWPLSHACTHGRSRTTGVLESDLLGVGSDESDLPEIRFEHHAFCCGAIR